MRQRTDRQQKLLLFFLVLCGFGLSIATARVFAEQSPDPQSLGTPNPSALVQELRNGGYNLYFRHAATEWSQADRVDQPDDWLSCDPARMRQLSAAGIEDARDVGQSLRALAIPVATVYASPYCRTRQTAEAIAMGPVVTTEDIMNLRVSHFFGGDAAIIERARARLATAPPPGSNNLFVAHGNLARAATSVYPDEGEGLIFRPIAGQRFEYLGRLTPAQWRALDTAGAASKAPQPAQ